MREGNSGLMEEKHDLIAPFVGKDVILELFIDFIITRRN